MLQLFQINPNADPETLFQLGAVGIALMVIRELISLIKYIWVSREPKNNPTNDLLLKMSERLERMDRRVARLYEWHNVKDEDGVMVWYVRRSLEDAIKGINMSIGQQNKILDKQMVILESLQQTLDKQL